uniref:WGS project CAEQ00000000 data, annotated contig 1735 n=1 Tax=Trypanosoma congolense (strain IL3000) TaxID=1068625 RepID=F9W8I3_TRYCI|nr:unnamed protein product [Trypanosoma congolense IL3000]
MSVLGVLLLALIFGVFWYLLRERRFPVVVMRVWFSISILATVTTVYIVCIPIRVARRMKWITKRRSEEIGCWFSCLVMGKVLRFLTPHIHIKVMEGSLDPHGLQQANVTCSCHTSFFDTLLFLEVMSPSYVSNSRALAKHTLWELPLLGKVIDVCGHFPIYFTSSSENSFSVDKEKQAQVKVATDEFINSGGNLCLFPEGALNRTPEKLKDFRHGTFTMILQHNSRLYYVVHNGSHEVWPAKLTGLPGSPADVYIYIGEHKYDAATSTAEQLSVELRGVMQKHVDQILELRMQSKRSTGEGRKDN